MGNVLHLPKHLATQKRREQEAKKQRDQVATGTYRAIVLLYADQKEVLKYQQELEDAEIMGKDPERIQQPELEGAEIFISDQTLTDEQATKFVVVDQYMTKAMSGEELAAEVASLRGELTPESNQEEDADIRAEEGSDQREGDSDAVEGDVEARDSQDASASSL